ncbi:ankyrin repeat protein [Seminavis robusta]|uniref:Ankyrin repeat protein n=1 Tax=Seminavis robusta TaxID=568900 RepID=A0A9N8F3H9_9STRA|nr:ankyrin repeat protein [Seminavis robusta]|eukprot:Sro2720_g335470.1 ankyrin repeat protein (233) ;mRNA; f:3606-4699
MFGWSPNTVTDDWFKFAQQLIGEMVLETMENYQIGGIGVEVEIDESKFVNHSENYKDPVTGACTNTIEGTWNGVKKRVPARKRTEEGVKPCLFEFMWRRMNQGRLWRALLEALAQKIQELYAAYCNSVENPPRVQIDNRFRQAESTDTFYSAVFCTVPRAERWRIHSGNNEVTQRSVCISAARAGSIPVIQWARGKEFPWSEKTCQAASEHGDLDVLKYLHENGCPWDENTC